MIAAIVPAAGHSQRMGRPKLILKIGDATIIHRVVSALLAGGASPVIVVTPTADAPGCAILCDEATAAGGQVLVPTSQPPDMRASVEAALDRLDAGEETPTTVLLAPADSPGLSPGLVARVIAAAIEEPAAIVVPVFGETRGHPIALPWPIAIGVRELPPGVGVNTLVALHASLVSPLDVDDPGAVEDVDTPEDYVRWVEADAPERNRLGKDSACE